MRPGRDRHGRRGADLAPSPRPPRSRLAAAARPRHADDRPRRRRRLAAPTGLHDGRASSPSGRVGKGRLAHAHRGARRATTGAALGGPRAQTLGYLVRGGRTCLLRRRHRAVRRDGRSRRRGLDVALLPVAGWGPTLGPGHMGPQRRRPRGCAADSRASRFPIHWGTLLPRRHRPSPAQPAGGPAARVRRARSRSWRPASRLVSSRPVRTRGSEPRRWCGRVGAEGRL